MFNYNRFNRGGFGQASAVAPDRQNRSFTVPPEISALRSQLSSEYPDFVPPQNPRIPYRQEKRQKRRSLMGEYGGNLAAVARGSYGMPPWMRRGGTDAAWMPQGEEYGGFTPDPARMAEAERRLRAPLAGLSNDYGT